MDPITMQATPGGEETLLGILQRLRDLSQQPVVPQNPMAQLGTVLQGFAAGTQGQPNPALQMFQRQHEEARRGLTEQAAVGGMLSSREERKERLGLAKSAQLFEVIKSLPESTPETRTYKFQAMQRHGRSIGVDLPDGLITGLITGATTPAKLEEAAKLVIRGYEMGPTGLQGTATISDAEIARTLDMPVSLVSQHRAAFLANPNGYLSSLGRKTFTALAGEETDLRRKNFDAMIETHAPEIAGNTAIRPFVLVASRRLYGKEYWVLSGPERDKALAHGAQAFATQQGDLAGQRAFEVALAGIRAEDDKPAEGYHSATAPYAPLSGTTTVRTAKALEAVKSAAHISDKNDRQVLKYIGQMKAAIDEYRDAVRSLPEYFPPMTGDRLRDLAAIAAAGTRFHTGAARIDPRTVPLTAIKRHVVNLGRISGTGARLSNYVAELEKESGGFDVIAGQDVKLGLANQVETFLNSQLQAMGLQPLPKYTPGKIVRLSSGKVVRLLPDGTQYVIGGAEEK